MTIRRVARAVCRWALTVSLVGCADASPGAPPETGVAASDSAATAEIYLDELTPTGKRATATGNSRPGAPTNAGGSPGPGGVNAATAYPPPMQTEKSVEATAIAERRNAAATAETVGVDEPVRPVDMVRYENPVLGLAFEYPSVLGEPQFSVVPGDDGAAWHIYFSRFNALRMYGVSPDYSLGRGGLDSDTYGYRRDPDGTVRWLLIPSKPTGHAIEPTDVMTTSAGVEVIVFNVPPPMGSPDEATPGPPGALVNLAGERFPGMIVQSIAPERLPHTTLVAILESIEVAPPLAPVER